MITRRLLPLTAAATLGLLATACPKKATGPMPLCTAEVASGTAIESEAQELPPDLWFSILLNNFDREKMRPEDEPRDCTGRSAIQPTIPPLADPGPGTEAEAEAEGTVAGCPINNDLETGRLPVRPLTAEDIVINEGPDGSSLVWVQAAHFEDGQAIGPVAMVEWTQGGIAVRALGNLRTYTEKARMRIETAGGQRLLVAESDNCTFDEKMCQRIMKLLPIINDRFTTVPLKRVEDEYHPGGDCLGEATFAMFDQHTSDLPDGWIREFEIVRSVSFDGEYPLVAEQVVVRDKDPNQPDAPPQDFREAANDRQLVYKDRYFETRGSVWDEMIENYGSVAHDASADADDE
ncbi:hypothetical protein G6O69_02995 [Pseudenhygromyxa sp. WMMC2535]|uniref:hypothetical protein n=1 Tax=Pseudenhygromyxa sp. WMMC2535 TaxID=2712867 RepID=UPI001557A3E4|nr:hypothetical protein [Pseudenhygromyxa sp. WMMC2535]NVB36784.1 hypothetical protein [Pseudenhygromyxa sp. WMMC2535]